MLSRFRFNAALRHVRMACRQCSSNRLIIDNDSYLSSITRSSSKDIHNTFTNAPVSLNLLAPSDTFAERHLGSSNQADIDRMCKTIGVDSVDQLIQETIPTHVIRDQAQDPLLLHNESLSESQCIAQLKSIASRNIVGTNYLGQGYHGTITPSVILRNLLENPAWYTAYTPYQAEISQGRLEGLFIFQTLVSNLTGMAVSNCSLLDEGTSAAEAMAMFARALGPKRDTFFVSDSVHPQTIDVIKTRAEYMNVTVIVGDIESFDFDASRESLLGALVQYPDTRGRLTDYTGLAEKIHLNKGKFCVAADPLALTVCKPPSEFGADAVVGTMQRFGVPMWFGGPHAAFLATSSSEVRRMPGRLIGESVDARNEKALRLTLQTREQHIRLDKATSNICTAQALLANMSAMYAVYHGPAGLQRIAHRVHGLAQVFAASVEEADIGVLESPGVAFFDSVTFDIAPVSASWVKQVLNERGGIQVRLMGETTLQASFDETHTEEDVDRLLEGLALCLQEYVDNNAGVVRRLRLETNKTLKVDGLIDPKFRRTKDLLPQRVFNSIQTETDMMRYLYGLQLKDLSLTQSMITLGSCTMKLNSASSLIPCSWESLANIHPFAPKENTEGYQQLLHELSQYLCTVTGFDVCSLQPTSGASGEYAGLLAIRRYLESIGQGERKIVLIPRSAHGTNPASAAMMGLQIKWIEDDGGVDLGELRTICQANRDSLAALMITYPSTHGIFESNINEICDIIHEFGGQVYMDGANMNAQLGLTSPGLIGADVCHLNLHKTFSIPHGGGGPGMGPICARAHLGPFLPGHVAEPTLPGTGSVSAAPYGQAGIAAVPWMFITMLGARGLTESGKQAILNANYMASRLKNHYAMPYLNRNGRCSHEFIIDISEIKEKSGIGEEDIAKRLMDYGFHAPTMSWPVHASLMIEPTESENIAELDRFVEAMISIREEIKKIESGECDKLDNPLKNAPHTQAMVCGSEWKHKYSRETAAFPLPWIAKRGKFWPSVARVNNQVGDKNLVLSLKD
jgi:glycine dehydrogenase